ncbi:MAG: T9SS type A sorting domain-containing protein, partial [Ignavibacteria bacterium]
TVLVNYCFSIFFPNLNTGYLATASRVLKTTNQGQNWFSIGNNVYPSYNSSLFFINTNTGFVTAFNGQFAGVIRTTNGGANWVDFVWGGNAPGEVFFPSTSTGYAAFSTGILKTTNTGSNWTPVTSPTGENRGLHFVNNMTGYLSSRSFFGPNIRKTTDGGNSWQVLQPGTTARLNDVFFVNSDTGYCAGDSGINTGIIIRTTNAGATWQRQFSGTSQRLRRIFFISANTGYIVGDSGLILKTTTGGSPIGIEPVSIIVPENYKLYQNYPNPFNPVTKIKFDLPHPLYAKLEVYDVLGRIKDVLLNRRLTAGTYEILWNASSFASGIYFVRIAAGNYSETKKMVLLK